MFWDVFLNSLNGALSQSQADARYPVIVAKVTTIDGLAIGSTPLYVNNSGKTLIVQDIIPLVTAANAVTDGPTLQIGSTVGGSDIYGSEHLITLRAVNSLYHFGGPGISAAIPPGGTLYANITAGGTGTTLTIEIPVIGILI